MDGGGGGCNVIAVSGVGNHVRSMMMTTYHGELEERGNFSNLYKSVN
jgi:hypothetical protein